MEFRFASIANADRYGLSFRDDVEFSSHSNADVTPHFRCWETLGDGFIQHAPDRPVTRALLADYLMSLSAAMLALPQNDDDHPYRNVPQTLSHEFYVPRKDTIEFAASVKWRESDKQYDKRRWFSVEEMKIGGRKYEHDKRYEEVREWCDGSPKAIHRMILPSYANGLINLSYAIAIREWREEDRKARPYMERVVEFLNWTVPGVDTWDLDQSIAHAYETCRAVRQSCELRRRALRNVESSRRNVERKREQETTAADAA